MEDLIKSKVIHEYFRTHPADPGHPLEIGSLLVRSVRFPFRNESFRQGRANTGNSLQQGLIGSVDHDLLKQQWSGIGRERETIGRTQRVAKHQSAFLEKERLVSLALMGTLFLPARRYNEEEAGKEQCHNNPVVFLVLGVHAMNRYLIVQTIESFSVASEKIHQ
jgi:hypothetical protein